MENEALIVPEFVPSGLRGLPHAFDGLLKITGELDGIEQGAFLHPFP